MGGYKSGFQGTKKTTVQECLTLSSKNLNGLGAFELGWREGLCSWRRGEEVIAELEYNTSMFGEKGTLWLRYYVDGKFMYYTVTIVSTVPHYGGRRWWFICPITKSRVGKLYLPPGATQFGSRKAHDLTYRSCQESGSRERSERFRRKVALRLGADYAGLC